jgi:glycosyltransferase involved in cell wall biosynthesis
MIVRDEEKNLPRVLTSIKGLADQVVVVDTGSKDNTVQVAENLGAEVHFFEWCDDFSAARNESLKHATRDYILWLDADDELRKADHQAIARYLRKHPGTAAMLTIRCLENGADIDALQLRIFPNHRGLLFEGRIHEQVQPSIEKQHIPIGQCRATIIHYGYMDPALGAEKLQRNLRISELDVSENPESINALFSMARSLRFFGNTQESVAYIDKVLALAEKDAAFHGFALFQLAVCMKGEILCEWGRPDEALSLLEHYRQIIPQSVPIRQTLGNTYFATKKYEKAFEEYAGLKDETFTNQIALNNPTEAKRLVRERLAASALYAGRKDAAEEHFLRNINEQPQEVANYHCLSIARERDGDFDGAVDACLLGLRQVQDGGLRKRLFILLARAGRFPEALEEYEHLNGAGTDVDALSARFLVSCKTLNAADIHHYYGLLEQRLGLKTDPFPEGLKEMRLKLKEVADARSCNLFEAGVAFLTDMAG